MSICFSFEDIVDENSLPKIYSYDIRDGLDMFSILRCLLPVLKYKYFKAFWHSALLYEKLKRIYCFSLFSLLKKMYQTIWRYTYVNITEMVIDKYTLNNKNSL